MSCFDGFPLPPRDEDIPWDTPDDEYEPTGGEDWRGDLHTEDWPESLAGPEYWLYKQEEDEDAA